MLLLDYFMAIFFIARVCEAQLVPMYTPQLYNVPSYVNMGVNSYTQTRKLAKAANRLGVPTIPPKTVAKLATDVGVPLALQAPTLIKLGNDIGLPLFPRAPGLARPAGLVGMPGLPKALSRGLPMLPQIQAPKIPGLQLNPIPSAAMLLQSNPLKKRESPLRTRSVSNIKNVERYKSDALIDPVGQTTDGRDKEILGSPFPYENNYPEVHSARIRSPVQDTSVDQFDYLTKAANPLDDLKPKIGSMVNKMKHGFKSAVEKVDKSLRPNHERSEGKEANGEEEDSAPYTVWVKDPAGEKHDLTESVKEKLVKPSPKDSEGDKDNVGDEQKQDQAVIDGMNKYVKMKTNRDSESLQERMPAGFASDLRKTMDEFQKSIAQSSLMQKAKSGLRNSEENREKSTSQDGESKSSGEEQDKDSSNSATSNEKKDSDSKKKSQQAKNSSENERRSDSDKYKSKTDKNTVKSDNQSRSGNEYANSLKNSGKSNMGQGTTIDEKPLEKFWEKASYLAKSISDAHKDSDEADSDPKVGTVHHHFYGGFPPNNNLYTGYYDNNYQNYGYSSYQPYYSGLVQAYYPYQSSRPIWHSALGLADSIVDHAHSTRYYKRSAEAQIQRGATAQNGASYSGTSQSGRQLGAGSNAQVQSMHRIAPEAVRMAQGIMGGNYRNIANSANNMGQAIAGTTRTLHNSGRFVKRSNQADTLYTPSIGLADSIYTVASDPRPIDGVRVLDSIGKIWTPATSLAQNIQNYSPKAGGSGSSQSPGSTKNDQKSKSSESETNKPSDSADHATKTKPKAGSGNQKSEKVGESKPQSDSTSNKDGASSATPSPAGIVKSATDLAQQITSVATNPSNYQYNPMTGAIWDPAVDMSSQIVGSVMNPGMYQNGYVQQSIPSYVNRYYPGNIQSSVFPAGNSWSPFLRGNSGLTYSLTGRK